uniref:WD_REPEATS_REGION domain-containing protein n=1 Tax=Heterorhabditis bacteriophora TaxID=37862 RepID=A0A1I7XUT4_HETBA
MENESDGNLVHLPPELLLLVFSNIPARHLMNNTSPEQIRLSTSELSSNDFDAARTYVEIEEERNRWKAWRKQENFSLTIDSRRIGDSCGHIATVDALRIFKSSNGQRFCLSGGRDRSIKLWDLNKIQENENKLSWVSVDKQGAHGGWIWCIDRPSQTEDQFLSCAWDCTIKLWKLTSSDITELGSSKVGSAATSIISSRDGLAMCSTFLRKVCLIDIKNGLDVVASYSHHAGPVFSLARKVCHGCTFTWYLY